MPRYIISILVEEMDSDRSSTYISRFDDKETAQELLQKLLAVRAGTIHTEYFVRSVKDAIYEFLDRNKYRQIDDLEYKGYEAAFNDVKQIFGEIESDLKGCNKQACGATG